MKPSDFINEETQLNPYMASNPYAKPTTVPATKTTVSSNLSPSQELETLVGTNYTIQDIKAAIDKLDRVNREKILLLLQAELENKIDMEEGQIYSTGGGAGEGRRFYEPRTVPNQNELEELDENLHKWFKEKWVRFGPDGKIRGACARGDDSEGKPKCLPQKKAQALGKKGRASAAARKRREDPNPERSGKAINVNTKKKTTKEHLDEFELPSLTQLLNPSQQQAPETDKPVNIIVYGRMPQNMRGEQLWDALMEILPNEYPTLLSAQEKTAEISQYGGAVVAQRPLSKAQKIVKQFQVYGIRARTETSEGVAEAAKKPNATTRHLRDYPVSDKDVAKPVKKPEKKKPEQGVAKGPLNEFSPGPTGPKGPKDYGQPNSSRYIGGAKFVLGTTNNYVLTATVEKYGLEWDEDDEIWFLDSPGAVYIADASEGEIELPPPREQRYQIHDLVSDYLNDHNSAELQKVAKYYGFSDDGEMNEGVTEAYQYDESNLMYRYDPDKGRLVQAMIHNRNDASARQQGYRDTQEQALRVHGIIRSKFDSKKFIQKQGTKWVAVFPYGDLSEDQAPMFTPESKCPHCGGKLFEFSMMNEKKDACYYKVKSRYKVWPSAYASGALVKCRKKGASNWGTGGKKDESIEENLGTPYPGTYEQETAPIKSKGQKRTPMIAFETVQLQLDEKWSEKYKKSINCSNPKGFSQKAHCAGRKKK